MTTTTTQRPTYQLLPPMSPQDYERTRESIRAHGVSEPVVVDEDGNVVDGHMRRQICEELGLPYPTRTVSGLTDDEKRDLAYRLNLHRRHLTIEQKRDLIRAHRARGATLRETAAIAGVTPETVLDTERRDRGEPTSYQRAESERSRRTPREDRDDHLDVTDAANHRGECRMVFTYFYPGPSSAERSRGGLPFRQASTELEWPCDVPLAHAPPTTREECRDVVQEIANRLLREMLRTPPATVRT